MHTPRGRSLPVRADPQGREATQAKRALEYVCRLCRTTEQHLQQLWRVEQPDDGDCYSLAFKTSSGSRAMRDATKALRRLFREALDMEELTAQAGIGVPMGSVQSAVPSTASVTGPISAREREVQADAAGMALDEQQQPTASFRAASSYLDQQQLQPPPSGCLRQQVWFV